MDPAHRAVLRRLRLELSGQLLVSDTIVPLLYQEEVLTEAQVEDIESRTSERSKTLRLLDLLPSRGPRAFPVLLQALDDFSWVRDRLLHELRARDPGPGPGVSPGPGPGAGAGPGAGPADRPGHSDTSGSGITQGPEATGQRRLSDPDRVPSDRELSRLAGRLGAAWEAVLMELGLSAEDASRCRCDHASGGSRAAALAGLVRWRRAGGRRATLRRLRESLRAADVHPSVLDQVLG